MDHSKTETNQSFYDRISHAYDLIADANEHTAREMGERALAVEDGETVLELGFGTGNSLLHLAEAVGEDGQVYGIDISPGMKTVAEEKVDNAGFSQRVSLVIGDGCDLPFENDTFDAVYTSFTLELFALEKIPEVLAEIRRVLKPEGRFGVVCMAKVPEGEAESALEKMYVWMHRHFPHFVDCQPIDAASNLREAGFEITLETGMKIWTMPVAVLVGEC